MRQRKYDFSEFVQPYIFSFVIMQILRIVTVACEFVSLDLSGWLLGCFLCFFKFILNLQIVRIIICPEYNRNKQYESVSGTTVTNCSMNNVSSTTVASTTTSFRFGIFRRRHC